MATIDPQTEDHPPARPEYSDPVETEERAPEDLAGDDAPGGPDTSLPPIVDPEGEIEALEDRSMPIEREVWAVDRKGELKKQVYIQQGLMWFGKIELYGLLAQAVKVVLEGDNPLGIDSILGMATSPRKMLDDMMGMVPGADTAPDRPAQDVEQMELEAGKILAAFAQVVSMAPELISQAYCIALAIPKGHRNWAIEWAFPNMDDEMGKDILHTFVDQNWGVMEDFFVHELPKIVKRIVKARTKDSAGPR
jgi:hypothetical protein